MRYEVVFNDNVISTNKPAFRRRELLLYFVGNQFSIIVLTTEKYGVKKSALANIFECVRRLKIRILIKHRKKF